MTKRALISVSDKTNIVEFAKGLENHGFEIISTGGTFTYLKNNGVACISIEDVTHFPEILEGRVKTLHPKIHGGLLSKRGNELHNKHVAENNIEYIDLVCVNLYPFEATVKKEGVSEEEIIENIDIGMDKGELLCLLGASGSGKSTILKAIGGFISIDKGSIYLDGEKISDKEAQDREVSTVFQSYGLFPHMSVIENIAYGLKFKGIKKKERLEKAEEFLDIIKLSGFGSKKISKLSGGEQQRVALARSLIVKPKLLLLDEPLSNIDAKLRQSMRNEIRSIQKEFAISTIFVTHDQEEAFELADRIIYLNNGSIVQNSDPRKLYQEPKSEKVLKFIGQVNICAEGYVRPEKIVLCENGEEFEIMHTIYKGAFTEILIKNEKYTFTMLVLNSEDKEFRVGDKIRVRYSLRKLAT